jgi:hypothetical protein
MAALVHCEVARSAVGILIERNGREIGDERVRGWRESQRRIQEIAESAAAGTL